MAFDRLHLSSDQRKPVERLGRRLRATELALRDRARRTPGVRVAYRVGLRRAIRGAGIAVWIFALLAVPTIWRPELIHPADIGSDSSNYLAASERLAAGHDIYGLVAGDRPAALDNPPVWTVPILSPPTVATLDLWKMALPDTARFYVGWALGLGATAALGLILLAMGPILVVPLLILLSQPLAVTAWSGNLNALIGPAAALVWWASQRPAGRWQVLAGTIVGLAACVKIGPAMLGLWLLSQRRILAVAAVATVGVAVAAITVGLAGPGIVAEYLGVVRSTSATPAPLSIPGFLQGVGVTGVIQSAALPAALLLATVFIFVTRRSPVSFALAILAMTFSTTVVREETIAIALVAGIAWIGTADPSHVMKRSVRPSTVVAISAGFALGMVVLALVGSLTTGGTDRSTLTVRNTTERPVVVRFSLYSQPGSFGYLVPPNGAVLGWRDLPGAAPPVMTVWAMGCSLVEIVDLPRAGASIEVGAADVRKVDEVASPGAFAAYVPDCAAEVFQAIENR